MARLLILLAMPEEVRNQYRDRVRAAFPAVDVEVADHHSRAGPLIGSADALMTFAPMLTDRLIGEARRLRWVQALGTGVDNLIDLPSLPPRVAVTNVRGVHGAALSEAAFMAMLALSRRVPEVVRNQDRRQWVRWPARLLDNKTVGILGVGLIAEALAPKCKAFGMTVVGISSAPRDLPGFDRMHARDDLAGIVGALDYLVLLTPYTPQTRHIVGPAVLAAMKPTAYLVNLARGGVVDEDALLAALAAGQIAGAALDVFATEPLPPEHPLWTAPNVLITPHLGGFNDTYLDQAWPTIEHNLRCFLAGRPHDMVNLIER